jgi:hypothetical protein
MRKITAMLVVLVALLTITAYAAAKTYQFTGVVKTIQKGAVKVGDKVTVHYRMIATDIEASAAAAKPKK